MMSSVIWLFVFGWLMASTRSASIAIGPPARLSMQPEGGERVVTSGRDLRLSCSGPDPIGWWFPPRVRATRGEVALSSVELAPRSFASNLTINAMGVGHVGHYACFAKTTQQQQPSSAMPLDEVLELQRGGGAAQVTYVYVEDPQLLLVPQNAKIDVVPNESFVVPCKPTSPDVTDIILERIPSNSTDRKDSLRRGKYDRRFGYEFVATEERSSATVFTCAARRANITSVLVFEVTVWVKPEIVDFPEYAHYVKAGAEVHLHCDVATESEFERQWLFWHCIAYEECKDARPLTIQANSSDLALKVVLSGTVACLVQNFAGESRRTALVVASDIEGGFGVVEEPDSDEARFVGDPKHITCLASLRRARTEPKWFVKTPENVTVVVSAAEMADEGYTIANEQTELSYKSTLSIDHLRVNHTGDYICRIVNVQNAPEDSEVHLDVLVPFLDPLQTNINGSELEYTLGEQNVEFTCQASGSPNPEIKWYKGYKEMTIDDRVYLSENNSKLNFKFIKDEDAGSYKCVVRNRAGSVRKLFSIVIKEKQTQNLIVIVSVSVVFTLIIIIILLGHKIRKDMIVQNALYKAGFVHFENGAINRINPDMGIDEQAELLPYEQTWEFPREKLKIGKQLGSGAFGVVVKAVAYGIMDGEESSVVAVKMVNKTADRTLTRALVSELKIMIHLGKHPNVVNLLGACTNDLIRYDLLVIVEYCEFGNLQNFLRRHRGNFVNQIDPETGLVDFDINPSRRSSESEETTRRQRPSQRGTVDGDQRIRSAQPEWRSNFGTDYYKRFQRELYTSDLISWSYQIASGMAYLTKRKILHGDLAARNVLLGADCRAKICDFGLAKRMYKMHNYRRKRTGGGPLPVKWLSIEAIRDRVFSQQSDAWAYGVLLWEMYSLGCAPYPGLEADEAFFRRLVEGYRMEMPQYATRPIYEIMLECWRAQPVQRPSFVDLVERFGAMLDEATKNALKVEYDVYKELNAKWLEKRGNRDYLAAMSSTDYGVLSAMNPRHDYVNGPYGGSSIVNPLSPDDEEDSSRYLPMRPGTSSRPEPHPGEPHYRVPRFSIQTVDASGEIFVEMQRPRPATFANGSSRHGSNNNVEETNLNNDVLGLNSIYEEISRTASELDLRIASKDQEGNVVNGGDKKKDYSNPTYAFIDEKD